MNNFYFIGVDVSKKKLDFCVMFENKVVHEEVVANHQGAVIALIRQLESDYGIDNAHMLICAEHTGQYTYPLVCACESVECKLWLEHPSNIKYSSGVQRGKNDKIDARRIAIYAARFEDKVRYYERPEKEIERLKQLEAERSLYVVDLAKYKAQLKDQKEYMAERTYNDKARRLKKLMPRCVRSGFTKNIACAPIMCINSTMITVQWIGVCRKLKLSIGQAKVSVLPATICSARELLLHACRK